MKPALRKRSFVALYVDGWLFAAVWQTLEWCLPITSPLRGLWYLALFVFAALELLLLRTVRTTPGRRVLGFVHSEGELTVSPHWLQRERWWTMLLGVLGLMEGVKEATRWMQGLPPPPFMGLTLSWDQAAAAITTSGLLMMAASLGVLRCSPRAALFGLALTSLTVLSWLLSWQQVDAWVDARTIAARAMRVSPCATVSLR